MFRIKICGIRLESDVDAVDRLGGDAIGLNFFSKSVRYLDPQLPGTRELSQHAAQRGLMRVGVFVNESLAGIRSTVQQVGLDAVQLHGDESPDLAKQLRQAGYQVIRAVKLPRGPFPIDLAQQRCRPWLSEGCGLILDADAGSAHGGSGKTLHWPSVRAWAQESPEVDWALAGGLRPENVAEAMSVSGARAVDTASGVECPRGVKNADRIAAFVRAATV
ncbi:phosphoribosylanthranilate isomerase [Roseiconus nitratireducens]|uniref:phosphoribosylanthranilate isomerase n=1 Tax=Roseiconus nitratireducens TaxID=2605748 RepID=UPI0013763FF3|nr:phosphoribosylanthranilate isomerase [Roseiconus nitratireducens]